MDGVDRGWSLARCRATSGWECRVRSPTGDATQDASLAAVRVNDIGLDAFDQFAQFSIRASVLERVDLADHAGNDMGRDRATIKCAKLLHTVEQTAFGAIDGAKGKVDIMPKRGLTLAGENRVLLRAAQDQAGRDMEDASRRHGELGTGR